MHYLSAEEALSVIQSEQYVYVHGSAATPVYLLDALAARKEELRDVKMICISTLGDMKIAQPDYKSSFSFLSLFVSANIRQAIQEGRGDYIPVFLSEISQLFSRKIIPVDVALIHVSPPDKHGYCSLGVSVDIARSAVKHARYVIAQVNPQMPRTHGDGLIHESEIQAAVLVDQPLPDVDYRPKIGEEERTIAKHIAGIIPDRATLQLGIGSIPDAVLMALDHHRDLGIHTEMFSNGVIDLLKKGVVTNAFKQKHRGKITTSFAMGTRDLYSFIDDNPLFSFLEASYVNDSAVIRKNPGTVAINSALEIDLTGQVCADSIGTYQYSGVGGQMDFMRGAALSENGIPIIAMRSTTKSGDSKIVSMLRNGAGIVTTRAHVHYVVTEYGVVNLYGKGLKERAKALCSIAHPAHREEIEKSIFMRFKVGNQ